MEREKKYDIAKGIGIFFLVSMHARYWWITAWIANFNMALFFFISGMFFKDDSSFATLIKKKTKELYFPFVLAGVAYALLHNLFFYLGITNDLYSIKGLGG